MPTIRAIVVDPGAPGRLAIREVDAPTPAPSEALVRVAAFRSIVAKCVRPAAQSRLASRVGFRGHSGARGC